MSFKISEPLPLKKEGVIVAREMLDTAAHKLRGARFFFVTAGGMVLATFIGWGIPGPTWLLLYLAVFFVTLIGAKISRRRRHWRMSCDACASSRNGAGQGNELHGSPGSTLDKLRIAPQLSHTAGTAACVPGRLARPAVSSGCSS